jgi:predicted SAM-dependent methyltransferase
VKLNLGCGANLFEGWTNVDIDDVEETYLRHLRSAENVESWPEWQRRQWEFLRGGGSFEFRQFDLMDFAKWPIGWGQVGFCEKTVDAIYLGQVVEHLNAIHELPRLLKQCFEVLKPGGVLRMTTPELNEIVAAYNNREMSMFNREQPAFYADASEADKLAYLLFGASGPNCTRKNYEGHFHCYTRESLSRRVREAGFTGEIDFSWPSKRLPDVRDFGESHSFALEVVK